MAMNAPLRSIALFLIFFLAGSGVSAENSWWAFTPPQKSAVHSGQHPVDFFVGKKLKASGLKFSPRAERAILIRRLYLVMLGVPPSPDTVDRFIKNKDPAAWENLVDQVLADHRYGERWAQHWLDNIRWAETVGFETNSPRINAWPYRDWVIAALNSDKPYDQFVFQQIAGDTVGEDAALGFLVAGPANLPGQIGRDEEAMRTARQDELDEVIRTVSQTLLGLTIGCARCHDHKFDPISERDYYALQAVFGGLRYGDRRWRGKTNDQWTSQIPAQESQIAKTRSQLQSLEESLGLLPRLENTHEDKFAPTEATAVRMWIEATENRAEASLYELEVWSADASPQNVALSESGGAASASGFALENQTRHFDNLNDGTIDSRQAFPWKNDKRGPAWVRIDLAEPTRIDRIKWIKGYSVPVEYRTEVRLTTGKWKTVASSGKRALRLADLRDPKEITLPGVAAPDVERLVALTRKLNAETGQLAKLKAGPQVYAASFSEKPEATFVLKRGDAMQRVGKVAPDVPAVLGKLKIDNPAGEPSRRLAFAADLIRADHPLTSRVIVNRIWQYHFATGLVETSSDFGKMGQPPSHPELLDWLACDLVEQGWSLKKLHRLILTSKTFQQSNRPNHRAGQIDANTRLLWRFPPRRAEAEAIRDSILTVSGKLNSKAGGVGFDFFREKGGLSNYHPHETFGEEGWRRMIYARKIRMQSVNIFGAFDCPDAGQLKPRRTRSITPLQALGLMNSPFSNRQAGFFAERLRRNHRDLEGQIKAACQLAFCRFPEPEELEALLELGEQHGLEQVCRVLYNTSEFVTIP